MHMGIYSKTMMWLIKHCYINVFTYNTITNLDELVEIQTTEKLNWDFRRNGGAKV